MILTYEGMLNKLKNNSERKITSAIYGSYYGNTMLYIFIIVFIAYFTTSILSLPYWVFFFIYWGTIIIGIISSISRKCCLGMSTTSFTYIKFYRIGYKERTIYEIPFDNIKTITYHKFLNLSWFTMLFKDNRNKIRNIKMLYSSRLLRFSFLEQRTSSKKISTKLIELQKVLDKGDF